MVTANQIVHKVKYVQLKSSEQWWSKAEYTSEAVKLNKPAPLL